VSVAEMRVQIDAILAELRSRPAPRSIDRPMTVARTYFSVEEVASMLGRSTYTFRGPSLRVVPGFPAFYTDRCFQTSGHGQHSSTRSPR
jgi:hypothetical protein